jgi:hypothetical protein
MPSITATAEPSRGYVLLQVNFSDLGTVTNVKVERIETDGTTTAVRTHTSADTSGDYIELSGGLAILYDTETPLDVAVYYIATGLTSGTATTPTTVVLASGGNLFLKSPLHPWADQRIVLQIPQEPECVPASAIFFGSMDAESRQARSSVFVVNNRRTPVMASRVRGSTVSTLLLYTRTFVDRDALITLNAPGDALFLQAPAQYGIPDQYMAIGDYTVTRLLPDHRKQARQNTMAYVEVDRPAGLADGVLGVRWADLCDKYATFGDATVANLTWSLVLFGYGSVSPGPTTAFRLYSDIPIDFATYGDIPTGSRTYQELMEGD